MNKIIFYDVNMNMCKAWAKIFKDVSEVEVLNVPFEDIKATYVVTAGNSYAIMTGGIDLAVRDYFGYEIQDVLQEVRRDLSRRRAVVGSGARLHGYRRLRPVRRPHGRRRGPPRRQAHVREQARPQGRAVTPVMSSADAERDERLTRVMIAARVMSACGTFQGLIS